MSDDSKEIPSQFSGRGKAGFWSLTRFHQPQLESYAARQLEGEIRGGVRTLCLIFLLLLSGSAFLNHVLGLGGPFLYTYLTLAVLAAHVFFATRSVRDVKALHLLAMALLVVSSTALVLQAHKVGTLGVPLYIGLGLTFVVVPLVPWGLREASVIVSLIYLVFTLSTAMNAERFTENTLLLLQFFMLSAALIVLILVARSASVRKKEIVSRFDLESAHDAMHRLSYSDPLTGVWNRRYLQENFDQIVDRNRAAGKESYFLLFDLNRFKQINDTFGHAFGDQVLQWVGEAFTEHLEEGELLVRMGGDEFALLVDRDPTGLVTRSLASLDERQHQIGQLNLRGQEGVTISFGQLKVRSGQGPVSFAQVYQGADKALYVAKTKGGNRLEKGDLPRSGRKAAGYRQEEGSREAL